MFVSLLLKQGGLVWPVVAAVWSLLQGGAGYVSQCRSTRMNDPDPFGIEVCIMYVSPEQYGETVRVSRPGVMLETP